MKALSRRCRGGPPALRLRSLYACGMLLYSLYGYMAYIGSAAGQNRGYMIYWTGKGAESK